MKEINERIKKLRKQYDLTQEEVANAADLSLSYYRRVENGLTSPNLEKLAQIADVFDVNFMYLLNDRVEMMENRVEIEEERLRNLFGKIPDEQLKLVEGLIIQAARLRVLLDDNWRDILENGEYERFRQSENMAPYDRKRPIVENYDSRDKQYASIINQLTDLLPRNTVKSTRDKLLGK